MRKLILICAILFLSSCASVQTTSIKTNIQAKQFNAIASKYMSRPTFITLDSFSNGDKSLNLTMDSYGKSDVTLWFSSKQVPAYLSMINKYLKWQDIAAQRGDVITKEIGVSKGYHGDLRFTFHSGNAQNQYLEITFCSSICLNDYSINLDKDGSIHLASLLTSFEKGKIKQENISTIYN